MQEKNKEKETKKANKKDDDKKKKMSQIESQVSESKHRMLAVHSTNGKWVEFLKRIFHKNGIIWRSTNLNKTSN